MKGVRNNFKLFEEKGDGALYLNNPVYREICVYDDNYFIRNTKTNEDCGQIVELYCTLFDEFGKKLAEPIYDEDCYEIVERTIK